MQEEKDSIIQKLLSYTEVSQGATTYEYLKIICKLIYSGIIVQDSFEPNLEETCGLMDEKKGMSIGKRRMEIMKKNF